MLITWEIEDFLNSIKNALNNYKEKAYTGMEEVGKLILEEAKENSLVKYDTGLMEENSAYSISQDGDSLTALIGFMEFYSIYVHQGTGIYAIKGDGRKTPWWWKATTEKWLSIASEGKIISHKNKKGEVWIKTKGQHPSPFLQEALDTYRTEIPIILAEAINK